MCAEVVNPVELPLQITLASPVNGIQMADKLKYVDPLFVAISSSTALRMAGWFPLEISPTEPAHIIYRPADAFRVKGQQGVPQHFTGPVI